MGDICESSHNSHEYQNKKTNIKKESFDMPLWNNGKKVGYGIKEMPAYKCNLKVNELEKKRKAFWHSKKNDTKHIQQWNLLLLKLIQLYLILEIKILNLLFQQMKMFIFIYIIA